MSKPITKEDLGKFRDWLLRRAITVTDHAISQTFSGSAAKMTEWFGLDTQTSISDIPASLAITTGQDKTGLQWIRKEHYTYVLRNAHGHTLGTITGESSSASKEAHLQFRAKFLHANKWLKSGVFRNIIDAKQSVEDNLNINLRQIPRLEPLISPPNPPLWVRDDHSHPTLSQMFDFDGTCVAMIAQKHIDGDIDKPLFLTEVAVTGNRNLCEWLRVGYLEDLDDAERLATLTLQRYR